MVRRIVLGVILGAGVIGCADAPPPPPPAPDVQEQQRKDAEQNSRKERMEK